MNRAEQVAREMLVPVADDVRSRAVMLAAQLIECARSWLLQLDARMPMAVRMPVQHFRSHIWRRATERFPALEGLRVQVTAAYPAPRGSTAVQYLRARPPDAGPVVRNTEGDIATLVRALREPSAEVAASAAIALGECMDPQLEPMCRAALRETLSNADGYFNPLVRIAALQSLVRRLGTPPAPGELEPLLAVVRDVDAEVSMAAIAAVALHAPPNVALDRLLPVMLDDTGFFLPVVRNTATQALERAGLLTTSTG